MRTQNIFINHQSTHFAACELDAPRGPGPGRCLLRRAAGGVRLARPTHSLARARGERTRVRPRVPRNRDVRSIHTDPTGFEWEVSAVSEEKGGVAADDPLGRDPDRLGDPLSRIPVSLWGIEGRPRTLCSQGPDAFERTPKCCVSC